MTRRRATRRGTVAIFTDKGRASTRYQGVVNRAGEKGFEAARRRLATLAGQDTASDGDVMIALSIGWPATEAYVEAKRRLTTPS